jgi:hypothetical protein
MITQFNTKVINRKTASQYRYFGSVYKLESDFNCGSGSGSRQAKMNASEGKKVKK